MLEILYSSVTTHEMIYECYMVGFLFLFFCLAEPSFNTLTTYEKLKYGEVSQTIFYAFYLYSPTAQGTRLAIPEH